EGTPTDIARRPRTEYIAQLVGLNLYRGRADGHTVRIPGGPAITTSEHLTGPAFVAFPPGAVTLYGARPGGTSARNLWRCEVAGPRSPRAPRWRRRDATSTRVPGAGRPPRRPGRTPTRRSPRPAGAGAGRHIARPVVEAKPSQVCRLPHQHQPAFGASRRSR